jgi:hypothetical protein
MSTKAHETDAAAGGRAPLEQRHAPTLARVREIAVPQTARAISMLPRIDYQDAFIVETGPTRDRTAEQWARAIVEDAPLVTRRTLRRGWSALGFKLGPTESDGFVLGWAVRRSTPDVALLGASSRIGMPAELLLVRHPEQLQFGTFVQHKNLFARALWAAIEAGHKVVVRKALEQAARRWLGADS